MELQEVDQKENERAIACMGQIIANVADVDFSKHKLNVCLQIFLKHLNNEVTRLSAVEALIMIAGSALRVDLTSILVNRKKHSLMIFL